jgi:diacylglycerol kinase (ATP)
VTADVTLLVNPAAGRGRGAAAAGPAADALRAAGLTVRAVAGTGPGDVLDLARAAVAAGPDALVVVGGDGMVSLALRAVAGTPVPLGVVAVGTGNDIARACGLPLRDPAAAARLAADALKAGTARTIDLGRVGSAWFGSVLAAGLDAKVNDRANRMRRPRGRLRYDLALLAELAALRPVPYRIRLDDGPWRETEAVLVAVGNGPSYGGGLRICPAARLDDGVFHLTVVGPVSRRTLVRVFPRVRHGGHVTHPAVAVHRAARVELEAPGLTAYADGEPLGPLPLAATCVPGAARVLAAG